MDEKALVEVLKKLAKMAEDGRAGHMYNSLLDIEREALKAVEEAERGK